MNRVVTTRPFHGICAMQVCAIADATDEEILAHCNSDKPAGTRNGWAKVIRHVEEGSLFGTKEALPVKCEDDGSRLHFLVLC